MIPEKLLEIMKKDGVVAIATLGPDGPTWSILGIATSEYRKMNGCSSRQDSCTRRRPTLPTIRMF